MRISREMMKKQHDLYHKKIAKLKILAYITCMVVYSYTDYRKLILDYYQGRKAEPAGFTWREFAKLCGYASPVYLKLVAEGQSTLSEVGVERVASGLGLVNRELQYFRALVRFNQGKSSIVRKAAFAEMRELSSKASVAVLDTDQYDFYQAWHNAALRELVPAMPSASAQTLGDMLLPKVSAPKVRKSIELMERIGLLVKKDGVYEQTSQSISTGDDITSLSVRDLHRQMAGLAMDSLESVPREERDISGLTLGLSSDAYDRIVRELHEFRRKVVAIATQDSHVDRVYRLNLQLFPLSAQLNEGSES